MNQYEKLIEFIINENEDKARELFHQIVVEKSREIYENIIDETDFDESVDQSDQVEDLVNDVEVDNQGLPEANDDEADAGAEELDSDDMGMDDDMGGDDMGGDDMGGDDMSGNEGGSVEDRVMDLETALDDLKAEFDALMSDEGGDDMGMDDMGMDDMGGDDMGMDDMGGDDMGNDAMVREYVEKVSDGHGVEKKGAGEGHEIGKGGSAPVNKQSIVAKPNKMGGTASNIVKGGTESAPDGQRPTGKAGGFLKNPQEIDVAKRNVNKPGGNKGAQNYFSKKETSYEKAKGAEGQTTDGKLPVNPKSLSGGKVR
jgi:hypothetical protein